MTRNLPTTRHMCILFNYFIPKVVETLPTPHPPPPPARAGHWTVVPMECFYQCGGLLSQTSLRLLVREQLREFLFRRIQPRCHLGSAARSKVSQFIDFTEIYVPAILGIVVDEEHDCCMAKENPRAIAINGVRQLVLMGFLFTGGVP